MTRRILALGILLAACAAQAQVNPMDVFKWSTFQKGQQSKLDKATTKVIRSEAAFQTYWSEAFGESPRLAPKGVDWMKNILIAIHLGQRSSGGYEVRVTSIHRQHAADITIEYAEILPAKGSVNTQALTSPWVIIQMEKAAGNFSFKKTTRQAQTVAPIGGGYCSCCSRCTCSSGPAVEILTPIHRDFPNPFGNSRDRWIAWKEWDSGETSKISGYGVTVIRNVSDLGQYWMRHTGLNKTPWDREAVDWMKEQLIAINVGKTAGPGYFMWVDQVERTAPGEITIRYIVQRPAVPPAYADRVSSPYAIIKIERNTDRLVLVRKDVQPSLGGCACGCGHCRHR